MICYECTEALYEKAYKQLIADGKINPETTIKQFRNWASSNINEMTEEESDFIIHCDKDIPDLDRIYQKYERECPLGSGIPGPYIKKEGHKFEHTYCSIPIEHWYCSVCGKDFHETEKEEDAVVLQDEERTS